MAVFGTCAAGMAAVSWHGRFHLYGKILRKLFVNSPNALEGNYKAKCDTSSAKFQGRSGRWSADFYR